MQIFAAELSRLTSNIESVFMSMDRWSSCNTFGHKTTIGPVLYFLSSWNIQTKTGKRLLCWEIIHPLRGLISLRNIDVQCGKWTITGKGSAFLSIKFSLPLAQSTFLYLFLFRSLLCLPFFLFQKTILSSWFFFQKLEDEDKVVATAGMDDSDSSEEELRRKVPRRVSHSSDLDSDVGRSSSRNSTAPSPLPGSRRASADVQFTVTKPSPGSTRKEVDIDVVDGSPFLVNTSHSPSPAFSGSESPYDGDQRINRRGTWAGKGASLSANSARRRTQYRRRGNRSPSPRAASDRSPAFTAEPPETLAILAQETKEDIPEKERETPTSPSSPQEKMIPFATVLPVQGQDVDAEPDGGFVRSKSMRVVKKRHPSGDAGGANKAWRRRSVAVRPHTRDSANLSDDAEEVSGKPQQMPVVVHPMQVKQTGGKRFF